MTLQFMWQHPHHHHHRQVRQQHRRRLILQHREVYFMKEEQPVSNSCPHCSSIVDFAIFVFYFSTFLE
ncbi:hypothetical protein Pint_07251 [Pistacia integerrima]|uniref:Uncharacterized protein n=1 Tax=Pistacia integerrima TaxID=434235 RepID=A0ACC0Y0W5_9ROSI|nr:hypothetical protein Pint_07251 [Pistacia integerrima]